MVGVSRTLPEQVSILSLLHIVHSVHLSLSLVFCLSSSRRAKKESALRGMYRTSPFILADVQHVSLSLSIDDMNDGAQPLKQ